MSNTKAAPAKQDLLLMEASALIREANEVLRELSTKKTKAGLDALNAVSDRLNNFTYRCLSASAQAVTLDPNGQDPMTDDVARALGEIQALKETVHSTWMTLAQSGPVLIEP